MKVAHNKAEQGCFLSEQGNRASCSSIKLTRFLVVSLWTLTVIISLVGKIKMMRTLLLVDTTIEQHAEDIHARTLRQEEGANSKNNNWEYVYIPSMAPSMLVVDAKLPVPILVLQQQQQRRRRLSSSNNDHTKPVSISTLVLALPGDINKEYMKDMLGSLKAQTVPADEVVIVMSDVLTQVKNASHPEEDDDTSAAAVASDWCAATQNILVDLYYSSSESSSSRSNSKLSRTSSRLKLVCVGERMSAGRARNIAARFASGDVLSFIEADHQELPIRNQIIQNMFGLSCYPNGQLKMLLHANTEKEGRTKGHHAGYWKHSSETAGSSTGTSPFGFLPSGTECADKDDPNLLLPTRVLRGAAGPDVLHDILLLKANSPQIPWLTPTMHQQHDGHVIVHRDVFDQHVHFSSLPSSGEEDALYYVRAFGQRNDTVVFLDRPMTTYSSTSTTKRVSSSRSSSTGRGKQKN